MPWDLPSKRGRTYWPRKDAGQELMSMDETRAGASGHAPQDDHHLPAEPSRSAPGGRQGVWLRMAVRVLVIVVLVGAGLWWWNGRGYESTDDAQIDGDIY